MSRMSRLEAHRHYRESQKTEEKRMNARLLAASISVSAMSWSLGHIIYLFASETTKDTGPMMLMYFAALVVSAATGYASAKTAQRYARRYNNFNGMLPVRKRSRNPDTPFWR